MKVNYTKEGTIRSLTSDNGALTVPITQDAPNSPLKWGAGRVRLVSKGKSTTWVPVPHAEADTPQEMWEIVQADLAKQRRNRGGR